MWKDLNLNQKKGFDNSLSFGNLVCGFMRSTFLKDKSNIGKLFAVVGGYPIIFYITRKHVGKNVEVLYDSNDCMNYWPTADTWYFPNTKNGIF